MMYGGGKGNAFDMMSRNESQMLRFDDLHSQNSFEVERVVENVNGGNDDYGFYMQHKSPSKIMKNVGKAYAMVFSDSGSENISSF